MRMEYTLFIYKGKVSGVGVIHIIILTADVSVALPPSLDSKLRSLIVQTGNRFENVLSRLAVQLA